MTFLTEAKQIISQFFRATKSLASDAVIELTYQYHFAVLRQIGKTYALEEEAEKLTERIKDNDDRGCNFGSPSAWLDEQLKAPENANSIIVWDSAFSDTQWSVGVVITKDGNAYRVVERFSGKLDITEQLEVISKLSSQYPDAVVGILNKANGAALYRLLQSKISNIQQLETYFSDGIFLENIKKEGRLLFDFEYDEEREIAINYGVEYLHNQVLSDFTDVDLADLKEGDRLTNRWGNAPEFETEAETDAFKFVEMKQNISDDGLNEPRYPYDTEPSA